MTTAAQRIWEAIYAAALVQLAATEDEEYRHSVASSGVPNIMHDAALMADAHAKFATYKPLSRFRRRSR